MFRSREIADLVAQRMGLPRDQVRETIRRFHAEVLSEIAQGNRLRLHGLGTFKIHHRPACIRQVKRLLSSRTREVEIPASQWFRFKFSPTFRRRVCAVQTPLQHPPRPVKRRPDRGNGRPWWRLW
ncbi:HU family DNA-binding protein [Candidatus Sumerlaeota bacterium]|nr:HU family DNA-binding protein [Candidatus Sumerlaeota bacterium]